MVAPASCRLFSRRSAGILPALFPRSARRSDVRSAGILPALARHSAGILPAFIPYSTPLKSSVLSQPTDIAVRHRGRLPHWESPGATYFVTFRLADSLPRAMLASIEWERRDIL